MMLTMQHEVIAFCCSGVVAVQTHKGLNGRFVQGVMQQ